MAVLVLKFGGTSVADVDRIRNVAAHVKREADAGHACAVVVSAMAGATNQLVALVEQAFIFVEHDGLHRLFIRHPGHAIAQRVCGGCRRGADAPHERERPPESKPSAALVGAGALGNSQAVVQGTIMERAKFAAETEGLILHLVNREGSLFVPAGLRDVGSAPLDIMLGKAASISRARILIAFRPSREVRANEA